MHYLCIMSMRNVHTATSTPFHAPRHCHVSWALWLCLMVMATLSCTDNHLEGEGMGRFETDEATVAAMSSGQLTQLNVTEGQQVERGMVVGMIENQQLLMQRDELHSSLQQIENDRRMVAARQESARQRLAALEKQASVLRGQIADVEQEKIHYEELYEQGVVARNQVEAFDIRLDMLTRQLGIVEEQIAGTVVSDDEHRSLSTEDADLRASELSAQIAQIDQQLTGIAVSCPITGTVVEKKAATGDYVTAGHPLFRLADLRRMTLRAYLSASLLDKVKLGSRVKVAVETGIGNPAIYEGVVMWVSANAEFASTRPSADGSVGGMHAVKIQVENDGRIDIGMRGRVVFED